MRLTCPSCKAQYEIQDGLVPAAGRDVQCSNCGHGWFEKPMVTSEFITPPPEPAPKEPASTYAPPPNPQPTEQAPYAETWEEDLPESTSTPTRALDPEIADILREEAETDRELRAAEQAQLENQPELGLAVPGPRRIDHTGGQSRKDLLPDVDAINSSLRTEDSAPAAPVADPEPQRKSRFWSGFMLMVVLALIAVAIYVLAPQIMEHTPDNLDAWLQSYVDWVDALRLRLDLGLQKMLATTGS